MYPAYIVIEEAYFLYVLFLMLSHLFIILEEIQTKDSFFWHNAPMNPWIILYLKQQCKNALTFLARATRSIHCYTNKWFLFKHFNTSNSPDIQDNFSKLKSKPFFGFWVIEHVRQHPKICKIHQIAIYIKCCQSAAHWKHLVL